MRKQDDYWAWLHERSGLFTVHSAYRMLIKAKKTREDYFESKANCPDVERSQKEWNRLWSMKLPSKIKVFCWRLALNSIPTASVLKIRNLATTSECKICGAEEDTWDHSLLYCTMSRCVWTLVGENLTDLLATLHITDPKHWVKFMCCNIPQVEGKHVLATSRAIWNARRKAIHEGIFHVRYFVGLAHLIFNKSNKLYGPNKDW
jgi:hypothetical protein